jgi:hypothetical protein
MEEMVRGPHSNENLLGDEGVTRFGIKFMFAARDYRLV